MEEVADQVWDLLKNLSSDERTDVLYYLGDYFCMNCGSEECSGECRDDE